MATFTGIEASNVDFDMNTISFPQFSGGDLGNAIDLYDGSMMFWSNLGASELDIWYHGGFAYIPLPLVQIFGVVTSIDYVSYLVNPTAPAPATVRFNISDIAIDVSEFATSSAAAMRQKIFSGNDTIYGGTGSEKLRGFSGDDLIVAGPDGNLLDGGLGEDVLRSGAGDDSIDGGGGTDVVDFSNATGAVNFTVGMAAYGAPGLGVDTLSNIEGVYGGAFNDTLTGDAGDNILGGGAGDDTLNGMTGADTATYVTSTSAVRVNLSLSDAQDTLGAGKDTLISIENLTGSAFDDTLTGNAQANVIDGGAGVDRIHGLSGDDKLNGGAGADVLIGDAGNDVINGGDDSDRLFGGSGNDTLNGGAGADMLSGGPGVDTLDGGDGADRLYADLTADIFKFSSPSGTGDRIFRFTTGVHKIEVAMSAFGGQAQGFSFISGASPVAAGATQTFLFNTANGNLSFDADGTGAGAAVYICKVYGAGVTPANLHAGDILAG